MAAATSCFMRSICSGDASPGRFGITFSRTVPAPTSAATLIDTPRRSIQSRNWPSVSHSMSYRIAPCRRADAFCMPGVIGASERSPKMARVTPWRTALWARPSWIRLSSDCDSTSMKPGATAMPRASSSTAALDPGGVFATATTLSPRMPTSATTPARPLPSYTVPPRTSTS